ELPLIGDRPRVLPRNLPDPLTAAVSGAQRGPDLHEQVHSTIDVTRTRRLHDPIDDRCPLLTFLVGLLHPGKSGGDGNESPHPLWVLDGEVDCDPAAHRAPDEGSTLNPELFEHRAKILDIRILSLGFRGLAITPHVIANRPELLSKRRELVVPGSPIP